jgi:hypothetical protein
MSQYLLKSAAAVVATTPNDYEYSAPNYVTVDHHGLVQIIATGTGTGTWSVTVSYSPVNLGNSGPINQLTNVRTVVLTNLAPTALMPWNSTQHTWSAWISAVSGTPIAIDVYVPDINDALVTEVLAAAPASTVVALDDRISMVTSAGVLKTVPYSNFERTEPVVTTTIYVDCNRVDSYTANGSTEFPYQTIDAALATVATATCVVLAPGAYTSAGTAWPAYPLHVEGNGASITFAAGPTVTKSYFALDLNVVVSTGTVTYAGATTDRYYLIGGTTTGSITLTNGLLHDEGRSLLGGTVTVNGGTLEIISTTVTSQLVHTAGQLLIQNTNINATKSTAMITSTASAATSMLAITNSLVYNLGTGTALDISGNTQATAHMNSVATTFFFTASAASVIAGSAVLEVAACNYTVTPTGTAFTGTNWGCIGARTLTGNLIPKSGTPVNLGADGGPVFNAMYANAFRGSGTTADVSFGSTQTSGAITIGGAAQTGAANYSTGTGSQTINLGTGGTGVKTINIGTGAIADVLNLGSTLSVNSVMGSTTTIVAATTLAATTNDHLEEAGTAYAITLPTTLIGKTFYICGGIAYTIVIPSGVSLIYNGSTYTNVTKTVPSGYSLILMQKSATVWYMFGSATLS